MKISHNNNLTLKLLRNPHGQAALSGLAFFGIFALAGLRWLASFCGNGLHLFLRGIIAGFTAMATLYFAQRFRNQSRFRRPDMGFNIKVLGGDVKALPGVDNIIDVDDPYSQYLTIRLMDDETVGNAEFIGEVKYPWKECPHMYVRDSFFVRRANKYHLVKDEENFIVKSYRGTLNEHWEFSEERQEYITLHIL